MGIGEFSEERFPLTVSFGTSGGPERRTDVVRLSNGREQRNQRTRHSVRRFDAGSGVRSLVDLHAVLEFFEARRGRLVAFRFRDPFDARSAGFGREVAASDQHIATGDGVTAEFQLVKRYGAGADAYERPIRKPVAGTVRLAVDGVAAAGAVADPATGTVRFSAPPPAGASITAGFEFDVPVRFDTDHLAVNLSRFDAGDIPAIPLVEVLL